MSYFRDVVREQDYKVMLKKKNLRSERFAFCSHASDCLLLYIRSLAAMCPVCFCKKIVCQFFFTPLSSDAKRTIQELVQRENKTQKYEVV